jgi:hypothetical protein
MPASYNVAAYTIIPFSGIDVFDSFTSVQAAYEAIQDIPS